MTPYAEFLRGKVAFDTGRCGFDVPEDAIHQVLLPHQRDIVRWVVEHMGFNLGNAIKYIWRADEKGSALEDLRKAAWYVQREIERRERAS
jgi:hypothetical protein